MDSTLSAAPQEPPRTVWGILKSIGPGLIITANIVGTGELIATTMLGAEVGFRLLWFIIFSCFIKVFTQVELGRYTLSEGVGTLEALNRMPGPRLGVSWILWLWIFMYLGTLCQMSGMVGGIAELFVRDQNAMAHRAWAAGAAGTCAVLLAAGRYGFVEKFSTLLVVAFTVCTVVAVGALQWTPSRITGPNLLEGLSLRFPDNFATAFVVFGITGVGASELIFYPTWCLEKGYAKHLGPRDDSLEWITRAQGWMRVMRIDAWLSMAIYTLGTVGFYLLGASVLHSRGLRVSDKTLVSTLSEMYKESFGEWGFWVFVVGAFAVLYSTYFVSTASNARLFADIGTLFGVFKPEKRRKLVVGAVIGIPALTLGIYLVSRAPVTLVLIGGFAQALMLPFLGCTAIYFCHRKTHPSLRPGTLWVICLVTAFHAMTAVGIYQVYQTYLKVKATYFPS